MILISSHEENGQEVPTSRGGSSLDSNFHGL